MANLAEYFPNNRRDFVLIVVGLVVSQGLSRVPGLTIEPEELTNCKFDKLTLETRILEHANDEKKCWDKLKDCRTSSGE